MKTTFELQRAPLKLNKRALIGQLGTLDTIWNIEVDANRFCISFEYMTLADLESVRREIEALGYSVINDTHQFDSTENLN
ncbi:MAG: hypothetical protein MUO53_18270 [Maribacter sp.]|nr:hypothetical protein [Maribacter sp.]